MGKNNFKKEILEICEDYNSLNIAEKKWITKYIREQKPYHGYIVQYIINKD